MTKLTIMFSLFSLSNVSLNRLLDFSYSATAWSSQTFRFSSCASIPSTNKRVSYRPYRLYCCIISSAASWTLRKLTLFNRSLFFSLCLFAATRFISLLLPLTTTRPSLPTSSSSSPDPVPVHPASASEEQNGGGGCNPRSLNENGCGGSGMWKAESGWWTTASEDVEVVVEVDVELDEAELEFEFEVDPLLVFEVVRFGANYTIRQEQTRSKSARDRPSSPPATTTTNHYHYHPDSFHCQRRTLIFLFLFPFFPFFPLASPLLSASSSSSLPTLDLTLDLRRVARLGGTGLYSLSPSLSPSGDLVLNPDANADADADIDLDLEPKVRSVFGTTSTFVWMTTSGDPDLDEEGDLNSSSSSSSSSSPTSRTRETTVDVPLSPDSLLRFWSISEKEERSEGLTVMCVRVCAYPQSCLLVGNVIEAPSTLLLSIVVLLTSISIGFCIIPITNLPVEDPKEKGKLGFGGNSNPNEVGWKGR